MAGEKVDLKTSMLMWGIGDLLGQHLDEQSIDDLGQRYLPLAIDGNVHYAVPPGYWAHLKEEFRLFLCTKDKKYEHLRKQLSTSADKSHTTIVATIAAAMAVHFGVAAGVLVPFCALCLLAMVRIGKETLCATWN
jgi:hypothetical protein